MANLTPADNPVGRFSAEQHAALDAVFAAAAPLTPDKVDALIWALGELDKYVQLNGLADAELTPSKLSLKFHAIASAADKLLQALEITEAMPKQIRHGLEYFARQDAMKTVGGFPNHPPKMSRVPGNEEYNFMRFYEERQLQQNIEGIFQIREWARQAEEAAQRASKRKGKDPEEAARARKELVLSGMQKGQEFDIFNKIFAIWVEVLGGQHRTSTRSRDGEASGSLIRFTISCLELLGIKSLESKTAREKRIKQRIIDYALRNRVIEEAISGVIDNTAPVIDDVTKRRALGEITGGRVAEDTARVTPHAIRQRARRDRARSK